MKPLTNNRPESVFIKIRFYRFPMSLLLLAFSCTAGNHRAGAETVLPTDNAAAPYMGLYGGVLNDRGISNISATTNWLYRSGMWAESFLPTDSWAGLEGSSPSALAGPAAWRLQNPTGTVLLSVGLLPGYGPTPLPGCSLANGAAGMYNAHFQILAQNLANAGLANNTIVRLGWEFVGDWFAWRVLTQADADNYAAYWRQVVTAMRAVAPNLKFDWNGNPGWTSYPIANAYPGNAYVDYIGCDIYDQSWAANTYPYGGSITNAQRQINAWNAQYTTANNGILKWRDFAAQQGKPMSIPEWGVIRRDDGHGGMDNPYFVQKMYEFIQNPANNVGFHIYFDNNSTGYSCKLSTVGNDATEFPNSAALFKKLFAVRPLPLNNSVGTPGLAGGSDAASVKGAGLGCLLNASDNFHFAARTADGDDMFVVRIASMSSASAAQSGAMLRESTAANSKYAALILSNGNLIFRSRTGSGNAVDDLVTPSVAAPVWLKLVRIGNVVTGYRSSDGLNWSFAGSKSMTMAPSAFLGLAVSSGSTTALNATVMESVDEVDINTEKTAGINNPLIVDSASAGVTATGTWVTSSTASFTAPYNGSFIHDNKTNKGSCTAAFTPTIVSPGNYDVYARWSVANSRAINVPATLVHQGGSVQSVINEQTGIALWGYIGTGNFAAGTGGKVVFGNTGTTGYVTLDAVMFVPLPGPPILLAANPGFESDATGSQAITGWSEAGDVAAGFISSSVAAHGGTRYLGHYSSVSYSIFTSQTKTGLANGLYTLKAWVQRSGAQTTAQMEAGGFGGSTMTTPISVGGTWTQISISGINVTNGACTFGFRSVAPASSWIKVDDVEFYKQ